MFASGVSIAYVESMDTIAQNMKEVRPTFVVAVPRIYEKIFARITDTAISAGGAKRAIFLWARAVGEKWTDVVLPGKKPGMLLALEHAHRGQARVREGARGGGWAASLFRIGRRAAVAGDAPILLRGRAARFSKGTGSRRRHR